MKDEDKISALLEKLQDYEDTDPAYMNEEMKELRHFVLYTHVRVEESLGSLITLKQIDPILKYNLPAKDVMSAMVGGTLTLIEVDYYRKLEICSRWKILTPKERQLMEKVNNLRKYFSHASKFYNKLDELKTNRDKYIEALEDLVGALDITNKIFSKQKKTEVVSSKKSGKKNLTSENTDGSPLTVEEIILLKNKIIYG